MNRHSEIITVGPVSIETYIDGEDGVPDVVVLPSYGRDSGTDFDVFGADVASVVGQLGRSPTPWSGTSQPCPKVPIRHVG